MGGDDGHAARQPQDGVRPVAAWGRRGNDRGAGEEAAPDGRTDLRPMGLLEGDDRALKEETQDERTLPGALPSVWGEQPSSIPRGDLDRRRGRRTVEAGGEGGEEEALQLRPPATWSPLDTCGRPERGGGANASVTPDRGQVGAEVVSAGGPLCRRGGRRQFPEAGRTQGLEEGGLGHHLPDAAAWAA